MVFVVRTDLAMGKGKIAAQCSHAAIKVYKKAERVAEHLVKEWERTGSTKIVLKLTKDDKYPQDLDELERDTRKYGIPSALIHDAGRTQIPSGTATVIAIGPYNSDAIAKLTGHLKLL